MINPMLMRVIRAIIFDLDGTLIHSLPGLASSLNRVLERAGLPTHSEAVVRTFIGNGIRKLVERALPTDHPRDEFEKLVTQMSADYAETWKEGTSPYPGIAETLQALVDQKTGIAVFSNKLHIFCQEITDSLFPEITFSSVIGQREGVPVKPDPAGAFDVAKSLGAPPEEIAFLGDSTIDLITASNSGMIPIAAAWGYHDLPALQAQSPAHIIHAIEELLPIINREV